MPFGIHHKNRSKQALVNDPAVQGNSPNNSGSGSASPRASQVNFPPNQAVVVGAGEDARNTQPQQVFQQNNRQDQSQQYTGPIVPDTDRRAYQNSDVGTPSRSQSTRYSVGSAYHQQQQHHLHHAQASGSVDNLIQETRTDSRKENAPLPPPPPAEQQHKKGNSFFKSFRSSGRTEQKSAPPSAQYNNTSGLSRRLSKRTDNPPSIRTHQPPSAAEQQQRPDWQAPQDARAHLPSPQEVIEDGIDPYQIRPGQEDIHSAPTSAIQEHSQQQTIRPVQTDSESDYDDGRQLPIPPPHGNPHVHHQQSDSTSSNHYQYQQHPHSHSQQQVNLQLDPYRQQNPETVSQLSYDSPIVDQREEQQRPSSHSNGHSPTTYPAPRQEYPDRTTSAVQGPRPLSQYNSNMPNQAGGSSQPSRRTTERDSKQQQQLQGNSGQPESREGPPPNYSRQVFSGNQNQAPPTPGLPTQGSTASNYRGGPPQREQSQAPGGGEQGRNTPPPAASEQRTVDENYRELLVKYKKVKGLYFDKTAQVEQLQNTLANQRLSQSRTSLDDSEYMSRFQRLDSAIVNLAFNIRKDWRTIPAWIVTSCNQDAVKIGKQEMTGVGRACITKFLVDDIFSKTFHPALDPELSQNLKAIERNIRRFSPPINNQEESDALTSKIVNWRLATLEGLKEQLSSPQAAQHKADFLQKTTTNLHGLLLNNLNGEVPGIQEVAHSIVDLAVSIASNMPLESRDISIVYPLPGDLLQPNIMKTEGGIPALENPCEVPDEDASTTSGEKDEKDNEKSGDGKLRKEKSKQGTSILAGLIGAGSSTNTSSGGKKSTEINPNEVKNKLATDDGTQRVRFAGFLGVEVRGRQILHKAPVWTVGG